MTVELIGTGPVLLTIDEGVAHLRLNRPDASNGMDVPFLRALYDAVMTATGRADLRVLLLTAEGRNFCAGGDVKTFGSKGEALPDYLREATAWLQNVAQALLNLPAPVVAAVQGFAAGGGGLGLVCASDIVVAGRSAKFMSGAARVGMAPDGGSSVTLPQLVGARKALELLLLNPTTDAEEALRIGLVTRVVDDSDVEGEATAIARELAAGAPRALAAVKRLVWSGLGNRVEAQLPEEARTVSELSGTADSREGLAAVLERRTPRFTGD
ncbi:MULTISPECIES: enoyl-CoA hydratase-related protein [unclassified Pseudonocardia]|uniref:enoyl-CoA hydratase/isomerase family protein n=1 Tax=unclassified Pseudonocardia TaxID=2619320 RepID=UPI0001FFDDEC|nr:enoyl-CoA hydratase-related protein [Pseudonocardia sp. Ae707_Ps1]OLM16785.1 Enoyl-CoA hydratase [Pseudonocardia sp. Ae707_Ps1]